MKLNGIHQLLVYADDVNILDGSVQNTGTLVVASKENGIEVNAVNLSTWSCFEIRKKNPFKFERAQYLETTLTNQNSILDETKCRLSSGNAAINRFRIFCLSFCCPKI